MFAFFPLSSMGQYEDIANSLIKDDPFLDKFVENMYLTGFGVDQDFEYVCNKSIQPVFANAYGDDKYKMASVKELWLKSVSDDFGKRQL